jgi:hypothetical protein
MIQILGSILTLCSFVSGPIDNCVPDPPEDWRDARLVVTVYDPLHNPYLPDEDNVNCDDDCSSLALTAMDEALYGHAASCPWPAWDFGYVNTIVVAHPAIGERVCLDTGGAINCEYGLFGGEWQWICRLDILEDLSGGVHPANGWLLDGWNWWWVGTQGAIRNLVGE